VIRRPAVALAAVLGLTACGSGDDGDGDGDGDDDATIEVTDAWARTTPAGATTGAVYLTIASDADDSLQGVSVDPSVAAAAEMHVSMLNADGTSMMHPLPEVPLPAGEPVSFAPNDDHVMLVRLAAPLAAGATFGATLHFATAPDQVVTVTVSDDGP
jgi:copper(I)-binding protein